MNFPFAFIFYSWVFFASLMFLAWVICLRMRFWSAVDAVWAWGIGLAAVILFIHQSLSEAPHWTVLALLLLWSFRLGLHLTQRLKKHFPHEDPRYESLKKLWQDHLTLKSFLFFQFQAMTQTILFLPFACIFTASPVEFHALESIGIFILMVGIVGEAVADWQLQQFKRMVSLKNKVCEQGLWKYSRHPNYFFEWMVWVGFGILGLSSSHGISLMAPIMMYILLIYVTGVKPAEYASLRSKGVEYENYQRRTNAFFIGRRKGAAL